MCIQQYKEYVKKEYEIYIKVFCDVFCLCFLIIMVNI